MNVKTIRKDTLIKILFFILYLISSRSNFLFLTDLDDITLRNLLVSGEYGTLMLSYPLSFVFANLYLIKPDVSWYSHLLAICLFFNIAIFFLAKLNVKRNIHLFTDLILYVSLFSFLVIDVSLLSITFLFIVTAISIYEEKPIGAYILAFFAVLLYTNVAILLLPLFIIKVAVNSIKSHDKVVPKKTIFFISLLFIAAFTIVITPKVNKDYSQWLEFNKSRAYQNDYRVMKKDSTYTNLERRVIGSWYINDEFILPTQKIIENTPSTFDVIYQTFVNTRFENIIGKTSYFYGVIAFLLFVFVCYSRNRSKIILAINIAFVSIITFIFLVKYKNGSGSWLISIGLIYLSSQVGSRKLKILYLVSVLPFVLITLNLSYIKEKQFSSLESTYKTENAKLNQEFTELLIETGKVTELSIHFPLTRPRSYLLPFVLFEENKWDITYQDLLYGGWISRLDYFYKKRDISNLGVRRKYQSYYDYMISPNTAFVGSKNINENFSSMILSKYDELLEMDSCKHMIKIINESKNYSVAQVVVNCDIKD